MQIHNLEQLVVDIVTYHSSINRFALCNMYATWPPTRELCTYFFLNKTLPKLFCLCLVFQVIWFNFLSVRLRAAGYGFLNFYELLWQPILMWQGNPALEPLFINYFSHQKNVCHLCKSQYLDWRNIYLNNYLRNCLWHYTPLPRSFPPRNCSANYPGWSPKCSEFNSAHEALWSHLSKSC